MCHLSKGEKSRYPVWYMHAAPACIVFGPKCRSSLPGVGRCKCRPSGVRKILISDVESGCTIIFQELCLLISSHLDKLFLCLVISSIIKTFATSKKFWFLSHDLL